MATDIQFIQWTQNEPESWIEYRTIEVFHYQLSQVYRYVDNRDDLTATLETGAPRNPNTAVLFSNSGLKITDPSEREDNDQLLDVTFGNIDGTIQDMLDQISGIGYLSDVEIIYRKYYSGNLLEPASPPQYLSASVVNFKSANLVGFTAEDTDMTTKRVGSFYYTETFPGLLVD